MNCIISYLNFILFRIQRERKFADKQLKIRHSAKELDDRNGLVQIN